MNMQDVALLGVLAAIAVFGYYVMGKVDHFLDGIRPESEEREQATGLHIATSCLNAIPAVSDALQDIRHLHPHVHCNLSVGREQEVIMSFDRGDADVAIISANSQLKIETPAQCKNVTLTHRSFSIDHGIVEVKAVEKNPQHQNVLWKSSDSRSLVLRFIHYLCGQRP